jgi:uncharacterized protein YbaP (TraB family)
MKHVVAFLLFIISTTCASAQSDGILWRITGKGLSKPSYLFGTIHIYCQPEKIENTTIISAIDSSEVVAMELDLNDFSTFVAIMKAGMKTSGTSLRTLLSPKEYMLVDSVSHALTGTALEDLDNKSPMTVLSSFIISEPVVGCKAPMPVDFTIAAMAKKAGKISYGLESFEFQDSILSGIPDSTQVRWLMDFCRDIDKSKKEFKTMMDAYDAQQSLALYDIIFRTSPEMALFNDVLLVKRNIAWASFMSKNMHTKSYFMAVGAGHLGGTDGLITLLRQAGYTVQPVKMQN